MSAYLERYRNGECAQVWEELIALGKEVRQAPIYHDARAVARETMERARRNVEKLYQRLQDIGYQFESERPRVGQNPMDRLRDQLTQDPLMAAMFGDMFKNMGPVQEQLAQLRNARSKGAQPADRRAFTPSVDDIVQRLDAFEKIVGRIPLSVRAWCEIVGSVDLIGEYPGLASLQHEESDIRSEIRRLLRRNPEIVKDYETLDQDQLQAYIEHIPFPTQTARGIHQLIREEIESGKFLESPGDSPTIWISDPLYFTFDIDGEKACSLIEDQLQDQPIAEHDGAEAFLLDVAPDSYHKANLSGDAYSVMLPDPKADTFLHGADLYFVAYLRHSFLWGGFPGLEGYEERDNELIAYLAEGLEPI